MIWRSREMRVALLTVILAAPVTAGCRDADVVTGAYATVSEARQAGAIERGWVPKGIPDGATDIREAHDMDTNRRWGLFSFQASEADAVRALLDPAELSLAGIDCDIPARIEWWPVILRGRLNPEQAQATGLKAYRARHEGLVVIVNWNQGRAYYWSL